MIKNSGFLLLTFLLAGLSSVAQQSSCITDFDFLVKKIKNDYPGYADKTRGDKANEFLQLESYLRGRISLYPDSCGVYLDKYASYFRDEHLRVRNVPGPDKEWVKMDTSTFGRNIVIDTNSFFRQTVSSRGIEGLWNSWCGEIAVVRDTVTGNYLGVSVSYSGWKAGQVMFEFAAKENVVQTGESHPQSCDTLFQVKEFSVWKGSRPRKKLASLHVNRHILEIHDVRFFVRKTSSSRNDYALMKSYIPLHPNGSNTYFTYGILSDSTFFMRVNSFDGLKERIEKVIQSHWSDIMSRPDFIIDLRNNGGGQDDEWQALAKLIYTAPYLSRGVEWYACDDNIRLFEDALKDGFGGEEGMRWNRAILGEMRKHPGEFVIHPMMGNDDTVRQDTVYKNPRRVGIIINEANGSSAEQFLLAAKASSKVTLFGNQNTGGVLDYSNAVEINLPSGKYYMRYPMTRSRRLPDNPIDNIGISPDVFIPYPATPQLLDRTDTWVEFVKDWLEAPGK